MKKIIDTHNHNEVLFYENEIDKAKEYFEDEILEIASKHEASSITTIDDVCELANRWERENNLGDRFKVIENKEK